MNEVFEVKGKLFGVSVGPGDPELMTVKAIRTIRECDVVAVPNIGHKRQTAYTIAAEYLEGKELLDCSTPMTHDHAEAMAAYERIADDLCELLDAGKSVAYLCLGDIGVYSTYIYIHEIMQDRGYDAVIIPGVTSFSACAARLGTALCQGHERMLVTPVMARDVDEILDVPANKVFMKSGKRLFELRDKLAERGMLDRASMVSNCGLSDEKVFEHLADMGDTGDYFSVVIVKEA
ncbi:Cobalt-precorrin-2 C(20)-methyltransferase [Slackia heliotrinireducens]|uniref:Precorrin-2 C20-methyltransferase n=1 Tax=Slackia heliotrinireducens (strain ATCC 29202 / DSM 20476 / NCTC 11029 / RHS 1) TaxID=471855 RepID=C7N2I5_SLAHD|nr:precorrin-2 C20-methyltransferase [Slackia heliotrinireducens DSM 20476]VEH02853.1 Cobalt-precorrin-2 C(20)-methyltransferase [Slackia heliotrinireducens]